MRTVEITTKMDINDTSRNLKNIRKTVYSHINSFLDFLFKSYLNQEK